MPRARSQGLEFALVNCELFAFLGGSPGNFTRSGSGSNRVRIHLPPSPETIAVRLVPSSSCLTVGSCSVTLWAWSGRAVLSQRACHSSSFGKSCDL